MHLLSQQELWIIYWLLTAVAESGFNFYWYYYDRNTSYTAEESYTLLGIRYVCRWKNTVRSTNKKKIEKERRYQQMWRDPTDPFLENFPFIQTIYV
jgi:hypothetical protein